MSKGVLKTKDGLIERGKGMFSPREINSRIVELGRRISLDLEGQLSLVEVVFIVILKGGARFAFSLFNNLYIPFNYDFVRIQEKGIDKHFRSLGIAKLIYYNLKKRHINNKLVILLDDICDSGATFITLKRQIKEDFKPVDIKTCSLIWRNYKAKIKPDWFGLELCTTDFLFGFGMGLEEEGRYLNTIYKVVQ